MNNQAASIMDILTDMNTRMVETQPDTPTVDRMLASFNKQWEDTATACLTRAGELEDTAMELREYAKKLQDATYLTVEVKGAVLYEINARNRAASLQLVNPTIHEGRCPHGIQNSFHCNVCDS